MKINTDKIDNMVENHYNKTSLDGLLTLIEQVESELKAGPQQAERFSFAVDLRTFTPSEAWGDPKSQDRQQINKVFDKVRGGASIKERIGFINEFLDPEAARRKRSPGLIIDLMMIVESLQACLNDFGESPSGFVFEGFMAALTGGKQIAGKIGGTLPIEDFVAFTEFGGNQPASLKLLSPSTTIKGSITNLVDFLFWRGNKDVKYIVAYKGKSGDKVTGLKIFSFDINQENFHLILGADEGVASKIREAYAAVENEKNPENMSALGTLITRGINGYTVRGQFSKYLKTGQLQADPEKEKEKQLARQASREKRFQALGLDENKHMLLESHELKLGLDENFHYCEKKHMLLESEDTLLESKDTQWEVSFPRLKRLRTQLNTEAYGDIDLSPQRISELSNIYIGKLKGSVLNILTQAKSMTENIGTYFRAEQRGQAQQAAQTAIENTDSISDLLEKDLKDKSSEEI